MSQTAPPPFPSTEKATITSFPEDALDKFTTDALEFVCYNSGTPTPTVQFYFNGAEVIADNSKVFINGNTLTISNASVSDTGIYQCFVSNDVNTVQASWALAIGETVCVSRTVVSLHVSHTHRRSN